MRIKSIITFAAAVVLIRSSAGAYADTYDPVTNQMTIPNVTVGATVYTNVVATVGNVLSVGGAYPAGLTVYPLETAREALTATGWQRNFSISYSTSSLSCSGAGTRTVGPATTLTTFNITPTNSVPALASVQTVTWTYSNCTPSSNAETYTVYSGTNNYTTLGMNSPGVNYGVYQTPPVYPTSVSVGGTGIFGTEYLYTDSTEAISNGRIDGSYVVTPNTTTSAFVTLIGKIYSAAGTLTATEQDVLAITTGGVLTPISTNVQYTNGVSLIWTYH